MEKTPTEKYLDSLRGQTMTVIFPSPMSNGPIRGRLGGDRGRYSLVDEHCQTVAVFQVEEVEKFQGRHTIFVCPHAPDPELEPEWDPFAVWGPEPGDYDPADPDAYFPGSGEE